MTRDGDESGNPQRHEQLLNAMHEAACIYDEAGRFELVNDYLADFYGKTRDELEGEKSSLVSQINTDHDGDPFRELWDGEREEVRGEIAGEYPGHGWEVLEYRLTPLVIDSEVDGVVGVAREVTERRRRERKLERQNERLEEFASVLSHDLRNPLNVAIGRLDLVQQECDSPHLETITEAHDRMEALVDDLLTLARRGTSVGATEPLLLSSVVEDCWETVDTAEATLVVETKRTLDADRDRLRQLLENLVRNAVEHGGEDVTVTIGDFPGGFYVADDGTGLPDRDEMDLFAPGISTTDGGTGFGLGIVESICEGHGWEIEATESDDGGARFEITGVEGGE